MSGALVWQLPLHCSDCPRQLCPGEGCSFSFPFLGFLIPLLSMCCILTSAEFSVELVPCQTFISRFSVGLSCPDLLLLLFRMQGQFVGGRSFLPAALWAYNIFFLVSNRIYGGYKFASIGYVPLLGFRLLHQSSLLKSLSKKREFFRPFCIISRPPRSLGRRARLGCV